MEQVAPALHYAHENKLIHRDIKPENIKYIAYASGNGETVIVNNAP